MDLPVLLWMDVLGGGVRVCGLSNLRSDIGTDTWGWVLLGLAPPSEASLVGV